MPILICTYNFQYSVPAKNADNNGCQFVSAAAYQGLSSVILNWGLRLGDSLLTADECARKCYNVTLLSSEARILLHVAHNNCYNIKQSHGFSMLSSRAFYTKVRKLTAQGYLEISTNSDDRRKRLLLLTDLGRTLVESLENVMCSSEAA